MLSKLKNSLLNLSPDIESIISKIDFKSLSQKSAEEIHSIFIAIDENTKIEIHDWLATIENIKLNSNLNLKEKEDALKTIKTSQTILNVLKSLIDVVVNKIPIENKGLLKAGVTSLGVAASVLNIELSGIALLLITSAFPKFIMSEKFDEISNFIKKELPLQASN